MQQFLKGLFEYHLILVCFLRYLSTLPGQDLLSHVLSAKNVDDSLSPPSHPNNWQCSWSYLTFYLIMEIWPAVQYLDAWQRVGTDHRIIEM